MNEHNFRANIHISLPKEAEVMLVMWQHKKLGLGQSFSDMRNAIFWVNMQCVVVIPY
jgi:hypothetical protein